MTRLNGDYLSEMKKKFAQYGISPKNPTSLPSETVFSLYNMAGRKQKKDEPYEDPLHILFYAKRKHRKILVIDNFTAPFVQTEMIFFV